MPIKQFQALYKQRRKDVSCLLGVAPPIASMQKANMTTVQHHGFSFMIVTQKDQTFFFVFIKLPKSLRWPNKHRYTMEDAERQAAKYADLPVTDDILFGELWKRRSRGHLCCLEEGVYKLWHFGRAVLVGDSAHKMTPALALGGSCTIESVAVLVNELKKECNRQAHSKLSGATITEVFNRYQNKRVQRTNMIYKVTYNAVRVHSRDGFLRNLRGLFIALFVGRRAAADRFSAVVRGASKIDFVPIPARSKGTIGFDDENN
ncbi:MAG: hypothetical protein Q9191_007927, partial [Dirinaria sp. TL-2023a]